MAIEFGSSKWNRYVLSGLSIFGTVLNSPGWLEMDPKRPCVGCLKLMKWMA